MPEFSHASFSVPSGCVPRGFNLARFLRFVLCEREDDTRFLAIPSNSGTPHAKGTTPSAETEAMLWNEPEPHIALLGFLFFAWFTQGMVEGGRQKMANMLQGFGLILAKAHKK